MYPFREKFTKFTNSLKSNKFTRVNKLIHHDKLAMDDDDAYIDRVYTRHLEKKDFRYSSNYKQITTLIPSEFNWEWISKDQKHDIKGVIHLYNFSEALHGAYKNYKESPTGKCRIRFSDKPVSPLLVNLGDVFEDIKEEFQPYWKKGRFFDANTQSGYYTAIVQNIDYDKGTFHYDFDELWLLVEEEFWVHKIELDLAGYFDMLYLTKGATFWPFLFVKETTFVGDYELSYILKMLITLPELFPEEDYKPLFERFEISYYPRLAKAQAADYKELLADYDSIKKKYV